VSLPNGISFRPTTLAECTTVTDRRTDDAIAVVGVADAFTDAA